MFFRILKKDLSRKRGVNIILFLFMILATVFVGSSVNNIIAVSNAMDYCMEKGKVPDISIFAFESEGSKNVDDWLKKQSDVERYTKNESIIVGSGNITEFQGRDGSEYDCNAQIILQSRWKEDMLLFDTEGNIVDVENGHIRMQEDELQRNGLKIGDKITFKFGETSVEFEIEGAVIDPAFGGDFVGMTRYLISEEDFEFIKKSNVIVNYSYCIDVQDTDSFLKKFNKEAFNVITVIQKEMFRFSYVMQLITSGILIVVGICLIVMAFLILRFTIQFTLSEDYKEIGIMKAIGIRNKMIQIIYLVKYFVLISIASVIGCICSIPVSRLMLRVVGRSMMLENSYVNLGIHILCASVVAVVVLVLCYLCTGRLRKFTAIEAIRSGQTGERFDKKSVLKLHRCRSVSTPLFMAVNDILSNLKRYVVLILTFAIGVIIVIVPLNAITSMKSDEMADNFMMDTEADFFVSSDSGVGYATDFLSEDSIRREMNHIKSELSEKGYDIDINVMGFYYLTYYVGDKEDSYQIMTSKMIDSDGSYVVLTEGKTPVLDNEIVFSEKLLKKMGLKVGDSIFIETPKGRRKLIISGAYQNFMQMGQSAFIGEAMDLSEVQPSGMYMMQCYLNNQKMSDKILNDMKEQFPQYDIYNVQEAMATQLGSASSQLEMVKWLILVVICGVNVMVTILMMKIFILGEKSQIAVLKSIGYSMKSLRLWQSLRMGIAMLIGIVIGVILSVPLNTILLRPIFAMMGAVHMKIQVNPLEAYLIYPLVLLIVINIVAYIGSSTIRKIDLMEMTNVE